VVVELSVYSMDGDTPPLVEMLKLVEKYGANLIVDEAHAVGLYQTGIVRQLNYKIGFLHVPSLLAKHWVAMELL
jgi:7-keto-8-aminopelargonate synthetase-like enzyme